MNAKVFSVFRRKTLLDGETLDWIYEAFAWALRSFGSDVFYEETELIRPTSKYFPDKVTSSDETIERTFFRVRKYAGLENWPCRLQPQEDDPNPIVAPTIVVEGAPSGPGGSFSYDTGMNEAVITYNPSFITQPESLVAIFAHELAHYLSPVAEEPPPGGEEYWEHATDLIAVYLGFGIFMANSAFVFQQYTSVGTQGWSVTSRGYLSEQELTYALAIFSVLKEIDNKTVLPYLDRHLRGFYKKAIREVQRSSYLADLRSIQTSAP